MQEKLAEFNAALAEKEDDDREALEKELEELRGVNSEQLKSVAEKVLKATSEWASLENTTRQELATAQVALGKIQHTASDTAGKLEARIAIVIATLD